MTNHKETYKPQKVITFLSTRIHVYYILVLECVQNSRSAREVFIMIPNECIQTTEKMSVQSII